MADVIINNHSSSYIYSSLYESYIQTKIDAEAKLAKALKESKVISESQYNNIVAINEAKITEKIKARWLKFVAFIKGIAAKFMESITNAVYSEKDYLDKYKEIILRREPKSDAEYSYTGNYEEGIKRMINTTVPLFDYDKYEKELNAESDKDLIEKIMSGKSGFDYDETESPEEMFKSYFLALDEGTQEGKMSDLNMTDIFNFCYNISQCERMVKNDLNKIESSTNNIKNEINKIVNDNKSNQTSTTNTTTTNTGNGNQGDNTGSTNESAYFTEADGDDKAKDPAKGSDLKISTVAAKKMGSTEDASDDDKKDAANRGAEAVKDNDDATNVINKAAERWIRVCKAIVSAKLTAYERIAKDYMQLIRYHVRSYGGQDLKKDTTGQKKATTATKYSKDAERAKKEAEDAENDITRDKNNNAN